MRRWRGSIWNKLILQLCRGYCHQWHSPLKVDGGGVPRAGLVQETDVLDTVQGKSHAHLQLEGREVDVCYHLRTRMLHLGGKN